MSDMKWLHNNLNFSPYKWTRATFFILLVYIFSSCSGLSYLKKGDMLYTGAKIKLESTEKVDKREIKTIAKEVLRPEPNKSLFGMRPQMILYMMPGESPKTKFGKWIKKRGEAPVLMRQVKPQATAAVIDAKLFNIGIFNSVTSYKIVEKKHTASIVYNSFVQKPYTIKQYEYEIFDDSLKSVILSGEKKSFIRPERDYKLEMLKAERIRIDALLKEKGYFYFNPDYLLFKADTTLAGRTISLKLTLKDSIPENATKVYKINDVTIDQDYSFKESADSTQHSFVYNRNVFTGYEDEMNIKPRVILRSIYLKKDEVYSRNNHNITLNRLMSMGNFKFVQVNFSESDTTALGYLDVKVLMTPMPNYNFKAELDLVTKSNDYSGPRVNLSLLDRNTFRGAEFLSLSVAGSFEAQLGKNSDLYSYSFNPQAELTLPRFLVPFNIKSNSYYVPKTRFLLSYNYMKREAYFDMNTFQFIYGYKWKDNIKQEQVLDPINVSYNTIKNQSEAFKTLLNSNPFLKRSYEEQFIVGANYSFTYNEQMIPHKTLQSYFQLRAESAGNLLSLTQVIGGKKVSSGNPSQILGSIYSQFVKLSLEGRAYYNIDSRNKLVVRVLTGMAKAYGNSSTLPYSKQFFSGGPNSIRAFSINSLGPGTHFQDTDVNSFLQLGGDIKVEMNAEYRFDIYKFLKGATFIDAGNVWLQKSNPSRIGTPFLFTSFMNELAVGTGVGLRLDLSFFVLRFDLAMPLREPWRPKGQRWLTNHIDFGDKAWRSQNLLLNIAIGYPF